MMTNTIILFDKHQVLNEQQLQLSETKH